MKFTIIYFNLGSSAIAEAPLVLQLILWRTTTGLWSVQGTKTCYILNYWTNHNETHGPDRFIDRSLLALAAGLNVYLVLLGWWHPDGTGRYWTCSRRWLPRFLHPSEMLLMMLWHHFGELLCSVGLQTPRLFQSAPWAEQSRFQFTSTDGFFGSP